MGTTYTEFCFHRSRCRLRSLYLHKVALVGLKRKTNLLRLQEGAVVPSNELKGRLIAQTAETWIFESGFLAGILLTLMVT